jgi:dipeptidyl aminopeptidase/acylaminoacyl peptidase
MRPRLFLLFCTLVTASGLQAQTKAPLTIDDLFSYTDIRSARLAPDGSGAVIETTRADWKRNRFRDDLWLWRKAKGEIVPLTSSGHDNNPEWSPDGKHIAFISDRPLEAADADSDDKESDNKEKEVGRIWIIDPTGGEAVPLYQEPLKVHTFAWTRDSSGILFSAAEPLSKEAEEKKKREWKDVSRWRTDDRGDVMLQIAIKDAPERIAPAGKANADESAREKDKTASLPAAARLMTRSRFSINEIAPAPDGTHVAFLTNSISGRLEHPAEYEIYLADLKNVGETPKQLTHNEALERQVHWSPDGKRLYFGVFAASGNLEGKYRDVQGRLYALDIASGRTDRLGKAFTGSWSDYTVVPDGSLLALGQLGTEVQIYQLGDRETRLGSQPGSYEGLGSALQNAALLFRHSKVDEPSELFFADDALHPDAARVITHFNASFQEHALPQMKPYRWRSRDGKSVEGVLLYPPGRFEQKGLRMLTLIHGGPADADGNRFGADWYSWGALAAANGWLVFEPNYRGSTGYGDDFILAISPRIVSAPGEDILSGVDALVRDGIADPAHLAIGGYSYGGYMTNWLITQTTRFRSAVTGAGAVEHASNWGNDDLTYDDAWYLGGLPWQNASVYQTEAALFQFDKVRTPVHDVIGGDDVRVSASQGYLLERALDALAVPHEFLIFPGEGHSLGKNPWHGYIKVREELRWLEKYDASAVSK